MHRHNMQVILDAEWKALIVDANTTRGYSWKRDYASNFPDG